jgi:DNA-binding transcriptional LysR family regulator
VELFHRNSSVELTAAGALLREQAMRAVDAADDFAPSWTWCGHCGPAAPS